MGEKSRRKNNCESGSWQGEGQSCCGDLVLIAGLFLQSAEHKRAPRKY